DASRVGERRLAQPDPRESVALNQRIFAHPRARRHLVLPRHAHALAVAVKAQSMVAALDLVSDQAAERERRQAMRAAVGERNGLARSGAEQHDLLAAHGAGEWGPADLVAKGDNLPAVMQPHDDSSHGNCNIPVAGRNDRSGALWL